MKRKAASCAASGKRFKASYNSLDDLPWKTVARPLETCLDGDDGVLDLEEVNNVEIVYENTYRGRVVKFNVLDDSESDDSNVHESPHGPVASPAQTEGSQTPSFDSANLLPDWHPFNLHPHIFHVLHSLQFLSPTPIQSRAIPSALSGRDVIGVAETGSGKTLAYGIPILNHILLRPRTSTRKEVQALILTPTRELALQVSDHLNAFSRIIRGPVKGETVPTDCTDKPGASVRQQERRTPLVSVAAIVGGMSVQKQRRILDRGADIVVATPGRLWDILEEDETLSKQIQQLRFLVLDEADRMIEAGHFAEMDNILRLTVRQSKEDELEPEDDDPREGNNLALQDKLQTFVFSATLSKELQHNLKKRSRHSVATKGGKKPLSTLDDLLLRLDFRNPEPDVIDISPEGGTVATLQLSKLDCLSSDKDLYLYYFLLRYPGRSLVFLSAIDGIRRLLPLLELLSLKTFPLHSQLEQRQRLRNLDRFKSTPNAILLATDIAARGLDIPAVDHVIHYQMPRSADVFVHRNGRTARAMQKGFSLLLCAPEERKISRALLAKLGRHENDIPEISVEMTLLDHLKTRVHLARQIDLQQHKVKKQNHEQRWLKETAEAMDIELDSDFISSSEDDGKPSKYQKKQSDAKAATLKAELNKLLSKPLLARGISARYITSGSRPIVDDLIEGSVHETLLGLKRTDAGDDLVAGRKGQSTKARKEKREPAEWTGFGS